MSAILNTTVNNTVRRERAYIVVVAALLVAYLLPFTLQHTFTPELPLSLPSLGSGQTLQSSSPAIPSLNNQPLSFEQNGGQTDPSVRFMAHTPGGTLFFTQSGVTLALKSTGEF